MLNIIWVSMMIISFVCAVFTGRMPEVCKALSSGATDGVNLVISLAGVMALWTGVMKIAQKSGLVDKIASFAEPFIRLLFPEAKSDHSLCAAIAMNMTANFFGLGNAATPLGIDAMKKLQTHNRSSSASDSMCMLAVVNSASIQLVPSTLIALRSGTGSANPTEVCVPIWIASAITFVVGVSLCKALGGRR